MTYTRREFLALFDDDDPYEYIHSSWEFLMELTPGKIALAISQGDIFDATSQGEWDNASRFALKNWMTTIELTLRLICEVNNDQGTGMYILDVSFYNALFNQVNAESIMSAWINTTKEIRLMTILTIDELRREVWNEEIVSYKIAPPLGDS